MIQEQIKQNLSKEKTKSIDALFLGDRDKVIYKTLLQKISLQTNHIFTGSKMTPLQIMSDCAIQYQQYVKRAQQIYKSAEKFNLLCGGQYYTETINKQQKWILIFNESVVYIIKQIKAQNRLFYFGLKHKRKNYTYFGNFAISEDEIVYEGQGKLQSMIVSEQTTSDSGTNNNNSNLNSSRSLKYTSFDGNWRNGEIINGTKKVITRVNSQENIIQYYKGNFLNMEYHGQGRLKIRDKDQLHALFQYGYFKKFVQHKQ